MDHSGLPLREQCLSSGVFGAEPQTPLFPSPTGFLGLFDLGVSGPRVRQILNVSIPYGVSRPFRPGAPNSRAKNPELVSIPYGVSRPFRQVTGPKSRPGSSHVSIPYGVSRPFRLRPRGRADLHLVVFPSPTGFLGLFDLLRPAGRACQRMCFHPLRGFSAFSTQKILTKEVNMNRFPSPTGFLGLFDLWRMERYQRLKPSFHPLRGFSAFSTKQRGHSSVKGGTSFHPLRGFSAFSTGRGESAPPSLYPVSIPYGVSRPFRLELPQPFQEGRWCFHPLRGFSAFSTFRS